MNRLVDSETEMIYIVHGRLILCYIMHITIALSVYQHSETLINIRNECGSVSHKTSIIIRCLHVSVYNPSPLGSKKNEDHYNTNKR